MDSTTGRSGLTPGDLLRLRRFTTPTVYNGWEQVSRTDRRTVVNREDVRDFMPQSGPMVGYAVTLEVEPSNPAHLRDAPDAPRRYREYVESLPGPKIVVREGRRQPERDRHLLRRGQRQPAPGARLRRHHHRRRCPRHRRDGGLGFKALALAPLRRPRLRLAGALGRRGRGASALTIALRRPRPRRPARLHGHPRGGPGARCSTPRSFMDGNECDTVIEAQPDPGRPVDERDPRPMIDAERRFGAAALERFGRKGEWT